MVWFQVNVPLVAGCLLMAALLDMRFFKLCLRLASIMLMFLAVGMIVFGTKLGMIPTNAVAVLSVMVWLACVGSVIRRWFCSKRRSETLGSKAGLRGTSEMAFLRGAWVLDPMTGRLIGQIATDFPLDRLIADPVVSEAVWGGQVQLVRLADVALAPKQLAVASPNGRPPAGI